MNQNDEVITKFYQAFQKRDWKTMQTCYHPEAQFSDPVFPELNGQELKAMWHMLCANAKNFSLEFSEIKTDNNQGTCRWAVRYTFSRSGRNVLNSIQARFTFQDGLIIRHHDYFDFWRWSRMALGFNGILLGWSTFLKSKVQTNARKSLMRFLNEYPEYLI